MIKNKNQIKRKINFSKYKCNFNVFVFLVLAYIQLLFRLQENRIQWCSVCVFMKNEEYIK